MIFISLASRGEISDIILIRINSKRNGERVREKREWERRESERQGEKEKKKKKKNMKNVWEKKVQRYNFNDLT